MGRHGRGRVILGVTERESENGQVLENWVRLASFWCTVLGYEIVGPQSGAEGRSQGAQYEEVAGGPGALEDVIRLSRYQGRRGKVGRHLAAIDPFFQQFFVSSIIIIFFHGGRNMGEILNLVTRPSANLHSKVRSGTSVQPYKSAR